MGRRAGKAPGLQIMATDFLGDPKVDRMKSKSQAYYLLLLVKMWAMGHDDIDLSQCSIRNDSRYIASILGIRFSTWESIRADIIHAESPLLKVEGDYLVSEYLRAQARNYRHYKQLKRQAGLASAEARRQVDAQEDATPVEQKGNGVGDVFNSSSSTSSTTAKKKNILSKQQQEWFEESWARYPRKAGKSKAKRHFRASVKSESDLERFKAAFAVMLQVMSKRSHEWIPNGGTWYEDWQSEEWQRPPLSPEEEALLKEYPSREAILKRKEHLVSLIQYSTEPDELRREIDLLRGLIGQGVLEL